MVCVCQQVMHFACGSVQSGNFLTGWVTTVVRPTKTAMNLSVLAQRTSQTGRCVRPVFYVLLSKNWNIKIHRTIILPVVLYGSETRSLILREERRLRVFENRVLRRVFESKRDEVTGEWRKLHNEELNDLYCSPNIVRATKSRGMGWVGHVARMEDRIGLYRVLVGGNLRERDHLGDPSIDGRMILRCIFRKCVLGVCTGSSWRRIGTGGGHLWMQ